MGLRDSIGRVLSRGEWVDMIPGAHIRLGSPVAVCFRQAVVRGGEELVQEIWQLFGRVVVRA